MSRTKELKTEDLEKELENAGGCGLFHVWIVAMLIIPLALVGANMGAVIFEAMIPNYNCSLSYLDNVTLKCGISKFDEIISKAIPLENGKLSTCTRYDLNKTITNNCSFWLSSNTSSWINDAKIVQCNDWLFDRSIMRNTIMTEFKLVCGSSWAGYISQSVFMFGVLCGNIFAGYVSDRFGRRKAFLLNSLGLTIFGTATAFANSYAAYVILRGFAGLFAYNFFPILFILISEFVLIKHRATFQQLSQCGFGIGLVLLSLLAFLTKDWRSLQLTLSLPALLGIPIWWFLPESPRWLLHKNKNKNAIQVIEKVHHINDLTVAMRCKKKADSANSKEGVEMEQSTTEGNTEVITVNTSSYKQNLSSMLRLPGLRLVSFVQFYQWFAVSCVYYGLTLNAAELGGNAFLNLLFAAILEICVYVVSIVLFNKWGRRIVAVVSEIVAGLLCIAMPYVPSDIVWLYIGVSITGRVFIALSFAAMYTQTSEIYPTPIRSTALGICSAWARVGGIVSPLIAMLSLLTDNLAYIVFGIISILSGIVVLNQPETNKQPLTSTIEEGEAFITSHPGPFLKLLKKI